MSPTRPTHQEELPATSFAVLGMLSFGPMSGYDLKQFADKSIGHFYWSPAKSQIYSELRRLERAGMVSEQLIEQESRPDKRVYTLSEPGQEALSGWVNDADFERAVFKSNLMLRVFFGRSANHESLLKLLRQNLESEEAKLTDLKQMEAAQQDCPPDMDTTFTLLTIRGGIRYTNAAIEWSRETIAALESGVLPGDTPGDTTTEVSN